VVTCDKKPETRRCQRPNAIDPLLRETWSWSWNKLGYGTLGFALIAIALAGAILPGVPTVMPLLAGSYFLSQCNPKLRDRILDWRIFRRYRVYLDPHRRISGRARAVGLGAMWLSITLSCTMFSTLSGGSWVCLGMITLGGVGSVFIGFYRQPRFCWRDAWTRIQFRRSVRALN
jgi:uncharacterized membrane protein YbaN (DUF454 family)